MPASAPRLARRRLVGDHGTFTRRAGTIVHPLTRIEAFDAGQFGIRARRCPVLGGGYRRCALSSSTVGSLVATGERSDTRSR
jgi:hypothetical protein